MRRNVGERFILGFDGYQLPKWLREFELEFGLGGVVVFDRDGRQGRSSNARNISSRRQLTDLCREVHELDSRPLVFVDQEGGSVRRLKPERGFLPLPSAADMAQMPSDKLFKAAFDSFSEMVQTGIDINFAPVLDLNTNPNNPNIGALGRSFSADLHVVERCARTLGTAARSCGLQLCSKHYPGLGGASVDSHKDVLILEPVSTAQRGVFLNLSHELPGNTVMLSHAFDHELDSSWPASLSQIAVDFLRSNGDHEDRMLVTDDLGMNGIRAVYSLEDAVARAFEIGIDMLCVGNNLLDDHDYCFQLANLGQKLLKSRALGDLSTRCDKRIRRRKTFAANSKH